MQTNFANFAKFGISIRDETLNRKRIETYAYDEREREREREREGLTVDEQSFAEDLGKELQWQIR